MDEYAGYGTLQLPVNTAGKQTHPEEIIGVCHIYWMFLNDTAKLPGIYFLAGVTGGTGVDAAGGVCTASLRLSLTL
jgi:hypothetical protein